MLGGGERIGSSSPDILHASSRNILLFWFHFHNIKLSHSSEQSSLCPKKLWNKSEMLQHDVSKTGRGKAGFNPHISYAWTSVTWTTLLREILKICIYQGVYFNHSAEENELLQGPRYSSTQVEEEWSSKFIRNHESWAHLSNDFLWTPYIVLDLIWLTRRSVHSGASGTGRSHECSNLCLDSSSCPVWHETINLPCLCSLGQRSSSCV